MVDSPALGTDSDVPFASLPTDGSEDRQIDDGSDRDSVTSELSTQDYTASLKADLVKALDELKGLRRSAALEHSNTKLSGTLCANGSRNPKSHSRMGPPSRHWYRIYAFLLVPSDSAFEFFKEKVESLSQILFDL